MSYILMVRCPVAERTAQVGTLTENETLTELRRDAPNNAVGKIKPSFDLFRLDFAPVEARRRLPLRGDTKARIRSERPGPKRADS